MKKSAIILFLAVMLFVLPLVSLQGLDNNSNGTDNDSQDMPEVNDSDSEETSDFSMTDWASKCVKNQVEDKGGCSEISLRQKIFSLASIGICKGDLLDEKSATGCFPKGNCDVKHTSLSLLALKSSNSDTSGVGEWISNTTKSTPGISWYLQVTPEDKAPLECSAGYGSVQGNFVIGKDNKIKNTDSIGNGLLVSSGKYWFEIEDSIYGQEIVISCNESFKTNLLFKKPDSSNIYVDSETKSSSAGGTTSHTVDSYCFKEDRNSDSCDYESSLWATLALASQKKDVSDYYPYLMTFSEENREYLPEAFLYQLTSKDKYFEKLFSEQKLVGYWSVSGKKYYDTAVALDSIRYTSSEKKQKTLDWLEKNQGEEGCWNNKNLRDTAFILYSLMGGTTTPSTEPSEETTTDGTGTEQIESCTSSGYYCVSSSVCNEEGGAIKNYSCGGAMVCCTREKSPETCSTAGGEICSLSEECVGGTENSSFSDLFPSEICCVGGKCESVGTGNGTGGSQNNTGQDCNNAGGACRTECSSDEEIQYEDCPDTEICCVSDISGEDEEGSSWWIWVLAILVVLVVLGIIFRDKLKELINKIKSRSKSRGGPSNRPPGHPPGRPPQRRKIAPKRGPPKGRPPQPQGKKSRELDDTLKKLKQMGK